MRLGIKVPKFINKIQILEGSFTGPEVIREYDVEPEKHAVLVIDEKYRAALEFWQTGQVIMDGGIEILASGERKRGKPYILRAEPSDVDFLD